MPPTITGSHDLIVAGSKGCSAEQVTSFVEGAAHINAHHNSRDSAQQDGRGAAQGVQPVGDKVVMMPMTGLMPHMNTPITNTPPSG